MHLVDKEDHISRPADLRQNVPDALFKLTTIFRACQDACHIEPVEPLSQKPLRRLSARQPLRQSLNDRSLSNAGLSDERRIVLILAAEDLLHLAELALPADDRLHARRFFYHILAILLQKSHADLPPLLRKLLRMQRSVGFRKHAIEFRAVFL